MKTVRLFLIIFIVIIIFIKVFFFLFSIWTVRQNSMTPTLLNKRKVLVQNSRMIFFNEADINFDMHRDGIYLIKGDGSLRKNTLIKRCIGIPGDSIWYNQNEVVVKTFGNSTTNSKNSKNYAIYYQIDSINKQIFIKSKSANRQSYISFSDSTSIRDDFFFFIGDNLSHSVDSRSFGAIERSRIIGYCLTLKHK